MGYLWDDLLSAQDRAVIRRAGYEGEGAVCWDSRSVGVRPALLVIDMQEMLVGQDVPILEAVAEFRTAMGAIAWRAVPFIERMLVAARAARMPVFFARIVPEHMQPDDPALDIIAPLTPDPTEVVIDKSYSSAFFGTDLLSRLVRLRVDSLIVVGNSTSGCVRATAVDARQHGFHPIIPVECVFDRIEASHKISLLDLWMKYAAVLPLAEVLDYIAARARVVV